jgi:hypothetical protein
MTDVWMSGQPLPERFQELPEFKNLPPDVQKCAVDNANVTHIILHLNYIEGVPNRTFKFVITSQMFDTETRKSAIEFLRNKFPQLGIPMASAFEGCPPMNNASCTSKCKFFQLYHYNFHNDAVSGETDPNQITIEQFTDMLRKMVGKTRQTSYYFA